METFKLTIVFIILFFNLLFAQKGKVVGIKDGDTIEILVNNSPIIIRLYGIDCPEKKQPYGTKAKEFTSQFCYLKEVLVKIISKDLYGRSIGIISLASGKILNQELVRNGLAWHYKKFAPEDSLLSKLEYEAKNNKIGLWTDPSPTPPWEFRKFNRKIKYRSNK